MVIQYEKASQPKAQALPVDTNIRAKAMDQLIAESADELFPPKPKKGRPKTDFDKEEYNRAYMRDLRTIKRLGLNMKVSEWRKQNGN